MITNRFSEILGKKKIKIADVIKHTGLTRPTLTALYYDSGNGINFETMDKLCKYLQVQPGELFIYQQEN
jgi:putative transcriptional regulator